MTETLGHYRLIRRLGVGGMAEVYLATAAGPEGFSKRVAVKRLLPHLSEDAESLTMFLDEARLAARFNHPNIAQVFDLGQDAGHYFVAMEYVSGVSLDQLMVRLARAGRRLDIRQAVLIARDVCAALSHAHELCDEQGRPLGVIHRDVSPPNIMISEAGTVKLLDFGIARAATNLHRTRTVSLRGKLSYLAPEQITQDKRPDQRVDLYALGAVLFEMLAGRPPFEGANDNDLMRAIVTNRRPSLLELRPELPRGVAILVERALRPERERRFPDARAMHAKLDALLAEPGIADSDATLLDIVLDTSLARDDAGLAVPAETVEHTVRVMPVAESDTSTSRAPRARLAVSLGVLLVTAVVGLALVTSGGPPTESPPASSLQDVPESATVERAPTVNDKPEALPEPPPAAVQAPRRGTTTGFGFVWVDSRPWTHVSIDGVDYGPTPMQNEVRVASGRHTLELVNPDLGITYRRQIRISHAEHYRLQKKFERIGEEWR